MSMSRRSSISFLVRSPPLELNSDTLKSPPSCKPHKQEPHKDEPCSKHQSCPYIKKEKAKKKEQEVKTNSLLQSLHNNRNILPPSNLNLDPNLLQHFQFSPLPDIRSTVLAWDELARSCGFPAYIFVTDGVGTVWEGECTAEGCGEDCAFAGGEGGGGSEEDEFVGALGGGGGGHGCVLEGRFEVEVFRV